MLGFNGSSCSGTVHQQVLIFACLTDEITLPQPYDRSICQDRLNDQFFLSSYAEPGSSDYLHRVATAPNPPYDRMTHIALWLSAWLPSPSKYILIHPADLPGASHPRALNGKLRSRRDQTNHALASFQISQLR